MTYHLPTQTKRKEISCSLYKATPANVVQLFAKKNSKKFAFDLKLDGVVQRSKSYEVFGTEMYLYECIKIGNKVLGTEMHTRFQSSNFFLNTQQKILLFFWFNCNVGNLDIIALWRKEKPIFFDNKPVISNVVVSRGSSPDVVKLLAVVFSSPLPELNAQKYSLKSNSFLKLFHSLNTSSVSWGFLRSR